MLRTNVLLRIDYCAVQDRYMISEKKEVTKVFACPSCDIFISTCLLSAYFLTLPSATSWIPGLSFLNTGLFCPFIYMVPPLTICCFKTHHFPPRNTLPPGPTNPPLHNLNTVPQNPTLRTPTSYAPADLRVHTSSIVPSHSRETPYHVPSDSRQTRGVDPHELNRVTAYLQANFPFIHGVMDVAPGSHISRLEAVCRVIQADVIWSRQCLDKVLSQKEKENNHADISFCCE